ncbi:hypothetical protein C4566_03535 [Candidatus Parcubacteria bacterium]|nr:MAG: hypothetical protein C4566_03535 [Candidatus Parcubacteria bacterium]
MIFLKPSRAKIILGIILSLVFIFLGTFHVQICKLPPCEALPVYSTIISFITLWPMFMMIAVPAPLSQLLEILFMLLVPFYYYIISCLWFYKKDSWKIKNYVLLLLAFLVIIFSIYNVFSEKGNVHFGPQFGDTINAKNSAEIKAEVINYAIEHHGEHVAFVEIVQRKGLKIYEDRKLKALILFSKGAKENEIIYAEYASDESRSRSISDEQYNQLSKINKLIIESEIDAKKEDSTSSFIFDILGKRFSGHQYKYEPFGYVHDYMFEYVGPSRLGIGGFPSNYSVYVDNKNNILFSKITGFLFID